MFRAYGLFRHIGNRRHIYLVSNTLFRYYSRAIIVYSEPCLGRFRHICNACCLQSYTFWVIFPHIRAYFETRNLAPDSGQYPAKDQFMSGKSYFTAQWTQLPGVNFFRSYYRLKTQKLLLSIGLYCSGFYERFNRKFVYQYLLFFCPARDSFSSENILYVIT